MSRDLGIAEMTRCYIMSNKTETISLVELPPRDLAWHTAPVRNHGQAAIPSPPDPSHDERAAGNRRERLTFERADSIPEWAHHLTPPSSGLLKLP